MTASVSFLGDNLGDSLGDSLGDLGGVDTIASLLGDSLRVHYLGGAFVEGGGGAPDVVTLTNLQGDTAYNATQATGSRQPHSVEVLGLKGFGYVSADDQTSMAGSGSPDIASTADLMTFWVVFKMDTINPNSVLFEVSNGVHTNGLGVNSLVAGLRARANAVNQSTILASTASIGTTNRHIVRVSLLADRLQISLDGVETDTSLTTGGLTSNMDAVGVGDAASTATPTDPADATVFQAVVATNPTSDQIAAVDAYLAANPGAPA